MTVSRWHSVERLSILAEWEAFAATLPPAAAGMTSLALRNLLLGMLGHDMRSPLNSILTTASYLGALNAGEEVSIAADRLIRSGASMRALLEDLVDFNRTNLGLGLSVVPSEVDLGTVAADELEQLRAAHPKRRIDLTTSRDNLSGTRYGTRTLRRCSSA